MIREIIKEMLEHLETIEECFNDAQFDNVTTLYRCDDHIKKLRHLIQFEETEE